MFSLRSLHIHVGNNNHMFCASKHWKVLDNYNHARTTIGFVGSMIRIKTDEKDAYKERETKLTLD